VRMELNPHTDWFGSSITFAILAAPTVVALWRTWVNVPETKGKSLEEISEMFADGVAT
jgi:hypothetical protein